MRRWTVRAHLAGLVALAAATCAPGAGRRGVLRGPPAAGAWWARAMDSLVSQSPESAPPTPKSLAFIVWDTPPIVIGAGSFLDRLAGLAGARNVFHDIATPSAQVSIETIAARDPDFVAVLSDTAAAPRDRKSTRLNSSHLVISYAVFCLKKKNKEHVGHDSA